jgi:Cu+-exporting ATPase
MFRRQFVQLFGAGSLAGIVAADVTGAQTVTYRVEGFSCVTCAVGLDAMLRTQRGVTSAHSSYPDGRVVIKFHPEETDDASLREFIADMGFGVEEMTAG